MKKLLKFICLLVVVIGAAVAANADTFTISSCNVDFAVNEGGSFYVRSGQIPPGAVSPPGVDASSLISGSNFHLNAGGAGYSDAGIVLYFNGGLKLGDLKSVSVVGTGKPASINLWLDTGGDGNFFAFDGSGRMTGLNGDSYGTGGASLDANTSIYMMAGNGAGGSYTLAQLQAGVVAGISRNTRAALWIGITNPGSTDISSIVVGTAAESALQAGGDRLAATQNTDGGWGWPLTGASQQNTIGPIAMGLAKAYLHTGNANQLAALQKAGAFLLAKTNTFSPPDGYLAAELDKVFGGNTYRNHVLTYFYNSLAAGTYNRNGAGTLYDTAGYINYLRTIRLSQGIPNLAAWDLGMGLVGAASSGASTSEWISGVKAEINELDGSKTYDVIGLAGAIYGLAFVHEDFDPTQGEHAAASNLNDLAAILASYQINNGGFADNKNNVTPGHEAIQETSYAMLALNEVNRSAYLNNLQGASDYLASVQMATGGWGGESGGNPSDENNEVTGEAMWGLSTVHILTNTCSQYTVTSSAGANGSIAPSGAISVNYGADQSFTITPNANYHVSDLLVDGSSVGAVTGYTFTGVTTNHTISASFAINTYAINASAGAGGSISPSGAVTVTYGADQSFTITPNTGYRISDVLVDSSSVGAVTSYTFHGVTAEHTISASFVAIAPLSITTSSLPSGTVLTAYSQTLAATGGVLPYTWSVSTGSLPDGLTINSSTGTVSGTPTKAGTFNFTAQVMDATSSTAVRNLSIIVGSIPVRYGNPVAPINPATLIQSAYDQCVDGYIIQVQTLEFPTNDILFDRPITITLQGGFDEGFTGNPSFTTINGTLTIQDGKVVIENIIIK